MSDHNLPAILESLKWVGVLKDPKVSDSMSESKPNPESKTEMESQREVTMERIKAANPDSLISLVLDFLDIEKSIKAEYAAANMTEKKKLIRWFSMGLVFMLGAMIAALWALGAIGTPIIIDFQFIVKFVISSSISLGMGFIVSKIKDVVQITTTSDRDYLLKVIQKASYKLSNM